MAPAGCALLQGDHSELRAWRRAHFTTPPWYAYLRIAEGCDNCCAYCVIPRLRGPITAARR